MKKFSLSIVITLIFFYSCSSWKKQLLSTGNINDAIHNAIVDLLHTSRLSKNDSVFFVYSKDINPNLMGVVIEATYDKILVSTKDSVEYSYDAFPTGYTEIDGNLFYWNDSTKVLTEKTIATYNKFKLIDTMVVNVYFPPSLVDHSKKNMNYYFCKSNLLKYKKVRTIMAMGYYAIPKLKCH